MDSDHRIGQLQELAPCIADPNFCSEEFPTQIVYVYYCDVCNSILALRNKLEQPQSFLYTTFDKCPGCHFELGASLKCQALSTRVPVGVLLRNNQVQNISGTQNFGLKSLLANETTQTFQKAALSKGSRLSFGNYLDECGGVYSGQLTVLYGENACQSIAERLCVRSQLPVDLGGFNAASVFIDGGNTFDLYQVSDYASVLQLERDEVLSRIKVSRAFTCYQLVNLILEKLPELLGEEKVGLIVIANLLCMFLDADVDFKEAKQTVNFLSAFLARFSYENDVAIAITCPLSKNNHEASLRQFLTSRARVVLKAERTGQDTTFLLEKHPLKPCPTRITDKLAFTIGRSNPKLDHFLSCTA